MLLCVTCFILYGFSSCNRMYGTVIRIPIEQYNEQIIHALFESMTLEQKSSQVLMTGISGKYGFSSSMRSHFKSVVPGAILLFRHNIAETPRGVFEFLASCNEGFSTSPVPVMYALDHEGGEVHRMGTVTTRLPSARAVASRLSPEKSASLYYYSGVQLSLLGMHVNLAPVAEVETEANLPFLGSRLFSSSPEIVSTYAASAIEGYRKSGVLTVLKHFPGNGNGDPHLTLSELDVQQDDFNKIFVAPFKTLSPLKPDAVLVSHIIVPFIEPSVPFCFSHAGVTDLLRKKLGFEGLILTDDISMGAIAKNGYNLQKAAVLALRAGCDMVMTSSPDIRSVSEAIAEEARVNAAFARRLDEAVFNILEAKQKAGLVKTALKRYSDSRQMSVFREAEFYAAKANADLIVEEMYDK